MSARGGIQHQRIPVSPPRVGSKAPTMILLWGGDPSLADRVLANPTPHLAHRVLSTRSSDPDLWASRVAALVAPSEAVSVRDGGTRPEQRAPYVPASCLDG